MSQQAENRLTKAASVAEMGLVSGVVGDLIPIVPAGEYLVALDHYRTAMMFGRQPKLIMGWRVVEGERMGIVIPRFYNVRQLKSKPGNRGKFLIGRHSDYLHDYVRLHGRPDRLDRMPMTPWRNCILRAEVGTVTSGRGGRELPEPLQYSKVLRFLEKTAG